MEHGTPRRRMDADASAPIGLHAELGTAPPLVAVPAPQHRLLRFGVQPLLIGLDVAGFVLAALLVRPGAFDALAATLVAAALFKLGGLYRARLTMSVLDDLPTIVTRMVVAAALVSSAALLLGRPVDRRILLWGGLAAVVVAALRGVGYAAVTSLRARGYVAHRTLVLGAGRVGGRVARLMLEHPSYGLQPVGFLDADPLLPCDERPVPVLGSEHELAAFITSHRVHVVVVAFGGQRESSMVDIIRTCDRLHCEIFYVPRLFELHHSGPEMDWLWGLPLIRLRRAAFRTLSWRFKRALDVVVAALALVLLAPAFAAIALAVRLEGGPSVLFRQERVGLDGRRFCLLKFRSLRPASEQEASTAWSIADDARVGPVGRLLRRTSLDELPQLLNILRGDMSLVGPRPERPHFVSQFTRSLPRYPARHRVPSGLTGWAQVHGLRGDTSIPDRAHFDNYYIENWSLWNDVKIVLRTIGTVFRREGG